MTCDICSNTGARKFDVIASGDSAFNYSVTLCERCRAPLANLRKFGTLESGRKPYRRFEKTEGV